MRKSLLLGVAMLTFAGCATTGSAEDSENLGLAIGWIAQAAAAVIGDIPTPAEAPPDDSPPPPPPPPSIRSVKKGPSARCANGHAFHGVCVRAKAGEACFFETDDGSRFDCDNDACSTVPVQLLEWCR